MEKRKLTKKQLEDGFIYQCTGCNMVFDRDEIICEECMGEDA